MTKRKSVFLLTCCQFVADWRSVVALMVLLDVVIFRWIYPVLQTYKTMFAHSNFIFNMCILKVNMLFQF